MVSCVWLSSKDEVEREIQHTGDAKGKVVGMVCEETLDEGALPDTGRAKDDERGRDLVKHIPTTAEYLEEIRSQRDRSVTSRKL